MPHKSVEVGFDGHSPEAVSAELTGCWSGLNVNHLGRTAKCGEATRIIGVFCDHCDAGRLIIEAGTVQCNVCMRLVGQFNGFEDDGPSPVRAALFLHDAVVVAQNYQHFATIKPVRISKGRPYWVIALLAGEPIRRIAWHGQLCPRCERSQLTYSVLPDSPVEGLECVNHYCGFGLEICSSDPITDEAAVRMWVDVCLEDDTPAWLARSRRIARSNH